MGCAVLDRGGEWVERAAMVIGRTEVTQHGRPIESRMFDERLGHTRLADPGLAHEQDDLAFAVPRLLPSLAQQRGLFVPPHQRRRRPRPRRFDLVSGTDLAERLVHALRALEALDRHCARGRPAKRTMSKPVRAVGDEPPVPGSASACSLAARLGVSPITASSRAAPSPTRSPTTT